MDDYVKKHEEFEQELSLSQLEEISSEEDLHPRAPSGLTEFSLRANGDTNVHQWRKTYSEKCPWSNRTLLKEINPGSVIMTYVALPCVVSDVLRDLTDPMILRELESMEVTVVLLPQCSQTSELSLSSIVESEHVQDYMQIIIDLEEPSLDLVAIKELSLDPIPTKEPLLGPISTKEPSLDPVSTQDPIISSQDNIESKTLVQDNGQQLVLHSIQYNNTLDEPLLTAVREDDVSEVNNSTISSSGDSAIVHSAVKFGNKGPSLKEVTAPIPPPRVTTLPSNHRLSFDTPPPPPPHNKPIHKRDSGFVSGTGEVSQTCGYRSGSGDSMVLHGDKPSSGDSAIVHSAVKFGNKGPKSASADGSFIRQTKATEYSPDEEDLSKYDWFWGPMSGDECAKKLQERGQIGNFIVRKNDRGDYVMSFWRKDGIHHHRILKSGNQYRFERSVIKAEGYGIPDLLDTYMKHCSDKTIGPFGGQLYPNYDVAWNPPEIDFNKFQDVLKKKADETGTKRLFKPGPEMGNNTYGGMSLEQIKDVIDKQDFSAISPSPSLPTHKQGGIPTPFAGFTPKPNPASPRPSIDNGKPNIRKSLAVPKSDRSSRSSPGHRLSTPNKSSNKREYNYATSPSHVPRSNNHTQISPSHQHDNSDSLEEEDEEQEVYIAPADMNEPIYQNHGEEKQTPYANVEYTKPSVDNDIYQNITFDGKPVTPPRRVQPQQPPQVQPRRKK